MQLLLSKQTLVAAHFMLVIAVETHGSLVTLSGPMVEMGQTVVWIRVSVLHTLGRGEGPPVTTAGLVGWALLSCGMGLGVASFS